MKKNIIPYFIFMAVSSGFFLVHAQASSSEKSGQLLGVIFKLENLRDRAIEDIQKYDGEIKKCDNTIIRSDAIVRIAQEKGNTKAEIIAQGASTKAQAARTKYLENKDSAELNKKRAEIALASVKNQFSAALSHPQMIKSVITDCSGRVTIQKKSGEHFAFDENQKGFLETGDEISTYENSHVELQLLDGRGTMNIGAYSRVKMEEDDATAQAVSLARGKIDVSVEKLEDYQKMVEEKIAVYKEDLKTAKDEVKQEIVDTEEKFTGKLKKRFEVITPSAVVADRGTRFSVREDEKSGTEVIVLEGSVEVKGKKETRTIVVNEGYKAVVGKDGKPSEPEKFDLADNKDINAALGR